MPKIRSKQCKIAKAVPYARGFKPPTRKRAELAIKGSDETKETVLPLVYTPQGFESIPRPVSENDWLAQYNEDGQSYSEFLTECPWKGSRKRRGLLQSFEPAGRYLKDRYPEGKIYLVPLGILDPTSCPTFEDIRSFAEIFFGCPVGLLPELKLCFPTSSTIKLSGANRKGPFCIEIASRFNKTTGHFQLQVGSILSQLKLVLPDDGLILIAFTTVDLFDTKPDLFVAGMAGGNARVGVFSFFRYNPAIAFSSEKWFEIRKSLPGGDMTPDDESKRLMLQRSNRLLVHEICHLLGIDHCIWYNCLMNGSGHLEEDFRQAMFLCPVDLRKLQELFGFSVVDRYRALGDYYAQHALEDEKRWVDGRLGLIGND